MKAFCPFLLGLLVLVGGAQCTFVKMCYFNCRGNVYQGARSFMRVSDIDHTLCTHLVWAHGYLELGATTIEPCPVNDPPCSKRFIDFNELKWKNPEIRLWMSIDGQTTKNFGKNKVESFEDISGDGNKRNLFAIKVAKFLRDARYDGLVLDWDLPNIKKGTDKNFLDLIIRLQTQFNVPDSEGPLFLAAAFSAVSYDAIHAYRPQQFYPHLTYMILKTYDYHLLRTKEAAFSSPLLKRSPSYPNLNMYNTLSAYLSSWKVPAEKIVVGLSFKGTRYILTHEDHTSPGSAATLDMRNGTMFRLKGAMTYPEVCIMKSQKQTRDNFDAKQKCPYIVYDNFWIGYEDEVSILDKIKHLTSLNVEGVMISDIEMDDVWGIFCQQGRYPLLTALQRAIGGPLEGRGAPVIIQGEGDYMFIDDVQDGSDALASHGIVPMLLMVLVSLIVGTPR